MAVLLFSTTNEVAVTNNGKGVAYMASETDIKAGIENQVTEYSEWSIGISDKPGERRVEHGNPRMWSPWKADTEEIARNVEQHFLNKGMKGAPGGPGHADWVYIFR